MKRERSAVVGVIVGSGLLAATAVAQPVFQPILSTKTPSQEIVAPAVACFAVGTDPIYARRVEEIVHQLNLQRFGATDYQLNTRWSGAQGSPRALTWSFVPDGLSISGGAGEPVSPSNLFAQMDAKFAAVGGRTAWINQYVSMFARWQALCGLSYTRVTVGGNDWDDGAAFPNSAGAAGLRGDLRYSGHTIDGVNGILAYNYFPATGDMVLDTAESWQSGSPSFLFLRNTIAHEHGHGLGLNHVDPTNNSKLMEAFLNTNFDGPQQDDIRAAQRHYGDPFEDNNTFGVADSIGALAIPGTINFGTIPSPAVANAALLSIDADGESDFWSFTVAGSCTVSATVTPVGTTYLQGPQGGATANVNALAMANLAVAILGTNGTTVLGSSDTQVAGVAETVSGVAISVAGTYYVRVTESNTPAETQLYRLSVTSTGAPVCPQISQNPSPVTVCQGSPASFTFVATGNPTPTYQWRRNTVNIPGATSSTYNIPSVNVGQAGSYDCVATNSCSSVTSAAVALDVYVGPAFTTNPSNQLNIPVGSPASFTVVASGNPAPTYAWRKNGVFIAGAFSATYTIPSVTAADAGSYDCVADNACDVATSQPATLTVASCYANCDGTGGLTSNDFQCFLNAYASGSPYANCDGTGGLTSNDFQCFLNAFANGCP